MDIEQALQRIEALEQGQLKMQETVLRLSRIIAGLSGITDGELAEIERATLAELWSRR